MKWAALILWVITALGGFGLLAIWLQRGGVQQADQPGRRIRPQLIFTHLALAATGLVLWIVYLAIDKRGLAWSPSGSCSSWPVSASGCWRCGFSAARRRQHSREAARVLQPKTRHLPNSTSRFRSWPFTVWLPRPPSYSYCSRH
jgi:hypothetical protein